MTSSAQAAANRRNAQNSTGPKTQQGKERARRNALRHGLAAEHVLLIDEDADDFTEFSRRHAQSARPRRRGRDRARRAHRHGQLALAPGVAPGGGRAQRRGDPHRPRPRARRALRAHPRRVEGEPARAAARPRDAVAAAAHARLDRARHGQRHERRAGRGSGHLEGQRRRRAAGSASSAASPDAAPPPERKPHKPDTPIWPEARMAALSRYEGAIERALHRAGTALEKLQARRREAGRSPPLATLSPAPGAEREDPTRSEEGEVGAGAPPLSRQRRRAAERAHDTNSAERSQFPETPTAPPAPPERRQRLSPPN